MSPRATLMIYQITKIVRNIADYASSIVDSLSHSLQTHSLDVDTSALINKDAM